MLEDILEYLKRLEAKVATKEDLKGFATKEDLKDFATKDDLKGFATKEDLRPIRADLETLREDLKGFATKEDLNTFATKNDRVALSRAMNNGFNAVYEKLDEADRHRTEIELKLENWQSDSRAIWEGKRPQRCPNTDRIEKLEAQTSQLDDRITKQENKAS